MVAAAAVAGVLLAGCGTGPTATAGGTGLLVSGSSTVAPITQAVARDGRFDVDVAAEGTTDGFERFCRGETVVNNASEAIPGPAEPVDYMALCDEHGVEYVELPVALDALSVVRHVDADFVDGLTSAELQAIWSPGTSVRTWADVRPEWPDREISFYGRPPGSGTFDWFTHRVVGETGAVRSDLRGTDDMDQLAAWVAGDPDALAFMGVGSYLAADEGHRDQMTNIDVDGVAPTLENARSGDYGLARPLFIYVSADALAEDEEVERFAEHYLDAVATVLPSTYFYPLPDEASERVEQRLQDRLTGSVYAGDPFRPDSIVTLLGG
ncbi:PstS family phosphate ABC transporter substrate-binding protein [Isoptericola halotolerans]